MSDKCLIKLMPKLVKQDQKGFLSFFVLAVLVVGLLATLYLSQRTQIFKPKAYDADPATAIPKEVDDHRLPPEQRKILVVALSQLMNTNSLLGDNAVTYEEILDDSTLQDQYFLSLNVSDRSGEQGEFLFGQLKEMSGDKVIEYTFEHKLQGEVRIDVFLDAQDYIYKIVALNRRPIEQLTEKEVGERNASIEGMKESVTSFYNIPGGLDWHTGQYDRFPGITYASAAFNSPSASYVFINTYADRNIVMRFNTPVLAR